MAGVHGPVPTNGLPLLAQPSALSIVSSVANPTLSGQIVVAIGQTSGKKCFE